MTEPTGEPPDPVAQVAGDPGLRRILEAARAWGVSPRRFLGWEPARVTTYRLDELGRILEALTTVEPEWDDEGRDLALALESYDADLCPGCRHPLAETTRPEAEEWFTPGDLIRCHRCTAAAQTAEIHKDAPHPSAVLFTVRTGGLPDHREDQSDSENLVDPTRRP